MVRILIFENKHNGRSEKVDEKGQAIFFGIWANIPILSSVFHMLCQASERARVNKAKWHD